MAVPSGERARVERHEHHIQGGWSRLVAALSSGSDRPLPYRFPVTGWHAQAVAGEGLRSDGQVMPNWVAAAFMLPSCSASA